jgi:L-asparaginase
MSVRILITGGTFDKEYDEIKGELFFDKTHIDELLKLGRCRLEVNISTLMLIDSLTMTSQDRVSIKNACEEVDEKKNCNNSRNRYNDKNRKSPCKRKIK